MRKHECVSHVSGPSVSYMDVYMNLSDIFVCACMYYVVTVGHDVHVFPTVG